MIIKYQGLDGRTYSEDLEEIEVNGVLLHATPDQNVPQIKAKGLKIGMPPNKLMVPVKALFCTIPSPKPNTSDLFRYYDDWSIIVIDTGKIPNHQWYLDFLAKGDSSNNGQNTHVLTFQDIPPNAIKKVLK